MLDIWVSSPRSHCEGTSRTWVKNWDILLASGCPATRSTTKWLHSFHFQGNQLCHWPSCSLLCFPTASCFWHGCIWFQQCLRALGGSLRLPPGPRTTAVCYQSNCLHTAAGQQFGLQVSSLPHESLNHWAAKLCFPMALFSSLFK